jgi:hypothetical protein
MMPHSFLIFLIRCMGRRPAGTSMRMMELLTANYNTARTVFFAYSYYAVNRETVWEHTARDLPYAHLLTRAERLPVIAKNVSLLPVIFGTQHPPHLRGTLHSERLGCCAYARRTFVEVHKMQPEGKTGRANVALWMINKLYGIKVADDTENQSALQKYRPGHALYCSINRCVCVGNASRQFTPFGKGRGRCGFERIHRSQPKTSKASIGRSSPCPHPLPWPSIPLRFEQLHGGVQNRHAGGTAAPIAGPDDG